MMITTPCKKQLKARTDELQDRLDKIIVNIVREFDLEPVERAAHLEKARILYEDLKKLEPAIDALDQ